jgi:hypothetical protein
MISALVHAGMLYERITTSDPHMLNPETWDAYSVIQDARRAMATYIARLMDLIPSTTLQQSRTALVKF